VRAQPLRLLAQLALPPSRSNENSRGGSIDTRGSSREKLGGVPGSSGRYTCLPFFFRNAESDFLLGLVGEEPESVAERGGVVVERRFPTEE